MLETNAISIHSPWSWNFADSYGLIACQLARHLSQMGLHVNCMGLSSPTVDNQPADIQAITAQPIQPMFGGLFLGWPVTFEKHGGLSGMGRRIAITMFESTKLPAEWPAILNEMHAVIVPARFLVDVFRDSGVSVPIRVAPLGISEVYQPTRRSQTTPMRFLAFLDRGRRKGGHIAIEAFQRAFGNDQNYRLVLKGRRIENEIRLFPGGNIEIIQQDMSEDELAALYASCDVLINPNSGEGFGLIPREASSTGMITLATDWGGTADDIAEWGFPIAHTINPADWLGMPGLEGQDLGGWGVPCVDCLTDLLTEVAVCRAWYAAQAMELAPNVHRLYSWRKFAEQVYSIWRGE